MKNSAIVIGAGIVGLATARALALKGYKVRVIEKNQRAVGASIRNFGMVWPVGQPSGKLYDRAMRSRSIWKEISDSGAFWHDAVGSIHLAYHPDEWLVLQELYEIFKEDRNIRLLNPSQVNEKSPAAVLKGCLGGLFSADEVIVDPRKAIGSLPEYLQEKFAITFDWHTAVQAVKDTSVITASGDIIKADLVVVCNGADFELLFPEIFSSLPITKCKLQMMRLKAQPDNWRIGPALCGGLSLAHYKSFEAAPSLATVKKRFSETMKEYMDWGIHVMVSQNQAGELTVGDSHEYGLTPDPFDRDKINSLILDYLMEFTQFKDNSIIETWNGVYPKLTNGGTEILLNPSSGVYILNGLGGAGMTLSFGLAEETVAGF